MRERERRRDTKRHLYAAAGLLQAVAAVQRGEERAQLRNVVRGRRAAAGAARHATPGGGGGVGGVGAPVERCSAPRTAVRREKDYERAHARACVRACVHRYARSEYDDDDDDDDSHHRCFHVYHGVGVVAAAAAGAAGAAGARYNDEGARDCTMMTAGGSAW